MQPHKFRIRFVCIRNSKSYVTLAKRLGLLFFSRRWCFCLSEPRAQTTLKIPFSSSALQINSPFATVSQLFFGGFSELFVSFSRATSVGAKWLQIGYRIERCTCFIPRYSQKKNNILSFPILIFSQSFP